MLSWEGGEVARVSSKQQVVIVSSKQRVALLVRGEVARVNGKQHVVSGE